MWSADVCRYCKEIGHTVRNCPALEKFTCRGCHATGHTVSHCPRRRDPSSSFSAGRGPPDGRRRPRDDDAGETRGNHSGDRPMDRNSRTDGEDTFFNHGHATRLRQHRAWLQRSMPASENPWSAVESGPDGASTCGSARGLGHGGGGGGGGGTSECTRDAASSSGGPEPSPWDPGYFSWTTPSAGPAAANANAPFPPSSASSFDSVRGGDAQEYDPADPGIRSNARNEYVHPSRLAQVSAPPSRGPPQQLWHALPAPPAAGHHRQQQDGMYLGRSESAGAPVPQQHLQQQQQQQQQQGQQQFASQEQWKEQQPPVDPHQLSDALSVLEHMLGRSSTAHSDGAQPQQPDTLLYSGQDPRERQDVWSAGAYAYGPRQT